MKRLDLSEETIAELRARHTEFLLTRLASEAGRGDLAGALRDAWTASLRIPLREVLEPARLADGIVRVLSEEGTRTLFAPIARDLARQTLAWLRQNDTKLGEHVPAEARQAIERLLERPDAVPERLVREVLQQEAVEHALRDVLYDGLKQFNDTANPFFAEWGIPALLSWLPVGGSAVRASLDTIRAEFDKRLEPEIRNFLLVFSRQATARLAEVFLARSNDPSVVAMRRHVVAYLYSRSLKELAGALDDDAREQLETASESIAVAVVSSGSLHQELRRGLEGFVAEQGDRSIGEWLAAVGATGEPDIDAWVDLLWPHAVRAIGSPAFRELVDRIAGEFYDSLRR